MPWSKERKREERLKKKRKVLEEALKMGQKLEKEAPPAKSLRTPHTQDNVGKNTVDYGGHHLALNFPTTVGSANEIQLSLQGECSSMNSSTSLETIVQKIGDLSIGLVCDGDWKAKSKLAGKGQRKMCEASEKFLQFLLSVKAMLTPMVEPSLAGVVDETLRVNCLQGARTLEFRRAVSSAE